MPRINKTSHCFDWQTGHTKVRRLSRSFATLEDAKTFAEGKQGADIYNFKGKYRVEWIKTVRL